MRILSILFPGFTALDLTGPTTAWGLLPGTEFQFAAAKAGAVSVDMGLQVFATHDLDECWQDPDVLFVPGGGRGVFDALQDDALLDAIARIGARAKWITSVCNGSLLLGAAGLLRGYRSASYWFARPYLSRFGAIPDSGRVVYDRNRASGGGITAGVDFAIAMAARWHGDEAGKLVELLMEYAPAPPFGTGRSELASAETRAVAEAVLPTEMPLELAEQAAIRRGFQGASDLEPRQAARAEATGA